MVVDVDGSTVGKHCKNHIPHVDNFYEKFYFRSGNLGVINCYDRHFPEE